MPSLIVLQIITQHRPMNIYFKRLINIHRSVIRSEWKISYLPTGCMEIPRHVTT